jgi:hypothetical protein
MTGKISLWVYTQVVSSEWRLLEHDQPGVTDDDSNIINLILSVALHS